MQFSRPLIEGRLIRRYKRFLADVELIGGEVITAHTANTGAMTGCAEPGRRVWLSRSENPKRKYPHTWELIELRDGTLVGINTQQGNGLVHEAIASGVVAELRGYEKIRTEVRYGEERSRIDLLLQPAAIDTTSCYVEVKNVTLVENGVGFFPDAVSVRASKHLRELMSVVRAGQRAVIFFCVPRGDVAEVRPAEGIDPTYAQTLREAVRQGVECLAYAADVSPEGVRLVRALPVINPATGDWLRVHFLCASKENEPKERTPDDLALRATLRFSEPEGVDLRHIPVPEIDAPPPCGALAG